MNRTPWRLFLVTVWLVSGLFACARTPAAQDPAGVDLRAAIQRWVTAVNSRDAATLAATMTRDVELMEDAATVTGRDAAIASLREWVKHGRLVATSREITIAGDTAWHVVSLSQAGKNGDLRARGQALEIWKRERGEWKLHRRMAGGAVPPELSPTRPPLNEPVLDQPKQ